MTHNSPRDGESVKEMPKMQCAKCKWLTADPDYGWCPIDGNILNTYPAGASYSIAHRPEKVASDEEEVMRPLRLHEFMAAHAQSFLYVTELEASLASSVARVEELEADRQDWILAAMSAMESLYSINKSTYCMPPSQYGMMLQAIRRVQDLWEPELKRRRAIELERELKKSKEGE